MLRDRSLLGPAGLLIAFGCWAFGEFLSEVLPGAFLGFIGIVALVSGMCLTLAAYLPETIVEKSPLIGVRRWLKPPAQQIDTQAGRGGDGGSGTIVGGSGIVIGGRGGNAGSGGRGGDGGSGRIEGGGDGVGIIIGGDGGGADGAGGRSVDERLLAGEFDNVPGIDAESWKRDARRSALIAKLDYEFSLSNQGALASDEWMTKRLREAGFDNVFERMPNGYTLKGR